MDLLYFNLYMKAIQVTVDERLLKSLDANAEAKRDGRSAVIRRALAQYLARRRSAELDERIRRNAREGAVRRRRPGRARAARREL